MTNTTYDRKSRAGSFWDKSAADRPLFGFRLQNPNRPVPRGCRPEELDLDLLARDAVAAQEEASSMEQDSVWAAEPPSCVPWTETSLESGTELYVRTVRALAAAAGGRFPVAQAELGGAAKVLSSLFGSEGLADSLHRYESMFLSRISAVERVQMRLLEATEQTSRFDGGYVLGGLQLWTPGTCALLRDDGAGLFSADDYERFFLPSVRRIAERTDFAVYSLGSDCLHLIDSILKVDSIACIDFRIDDGTPPLVDLLPLLAGIRDSGRSLSLRGPINKEDLDSILDGLPYGGLYLKIENRTPAEARFWSAYILKRCSVEK